MNHLFQHIQGHLYGAFRPRLLPTGGASAWTPLSLFAAGELGAWYDPSDLSTMFQDAAGTVPVTANNDPVRLIRDKSGRNSHATAPSDAARPQYKTAGGLHWLEFDGIDDYLATSAINFSAGTTMTMATAATKKANAIQIAVSIGTTAGTRATLYCQGSTSSVGFRQAIYGHNAVVVAPTPEVQATPQSVVLVSRGRVVVPYSTSIWRNDDAAVTSTSNPSATYGNSAIYIGAQNTPSNYLNGSMYGLIVRAAYSSDAEIAEVQTYLAAKIGGMP